MKKIAISLIFLLVALFTVGCSSAEDRIYEIIEETAKKEASFANQQESIKTLETEEKNYFDEIMDIGMKEFDEIKTLSDEALTNLAKREDYLKDEKANLDEAKKSFEAIDAEIEKMKDSQLKEQATSLQNIMNERFDAYDALYTAYMNGISEDRKIYEMLTNDELKIEDLETQIQASNHAYEPVYEANATFNEKTEQFNEEKVKFYKASGLKIAEN